MRPVVRSAMSSDVDIATYESMDPLDDAVWIRFMVGPSDSIGEESFDVLVCTAAWLARTVRESGPQMGRHHLIVDRMDVGAAIGFLRSQIEALDAPTWPILGERIGRIGAWEFEDYRP